MGNGLASHAQVTAQRFHGATLDWPATLRERRSRPLAPAHLRWRQHFGQLHSLHVFALDCSGSMRESGAFAQAKGLLLQWMRWAYVQRTPVALLCFGAGQVQWRLPPRRAPQWNADLIEPLPGGGGTPLAQALHAAWALMSRRAEERKTLWVLSDFRSPDVLSLVRQPLHCGCVMCWSMERFRRAPATVYSAEHSVWCRLGRVRCGSPPMDEARTRGRLLF